MTLHEAPVTLLTGATRGIGRETARQLSEHGHKLLIAARDLRRAEAAAQQLPGPAEVFTVDLASQASVRDLAERVRGRHERIDVLINNGGVMKRRREITDEGFEVTWAVNHLAPFLLSALLLEPLQRAGGGRIVNVNSEGHRAALMSSRPVTIEFDNLQGERDYNIFRAYSQAKLANLITSYETAARLTTATVNAVHPGMIRTDLSRELPRALTAPFHALFSKTPAEGAQAIVHLATAPELARHSGRYYDGLHQARSSPASHDDAVSKRLWSLTCHMVGLPTTSAQPSAERRAVEAT